MEKWRLANASTNYLYSKIFIWWKCQNTCAWICQVWTWYLSLLYEGEPYPKTSNNSPKLCYGLCFRVLKRSSKSRFDSSSFRNSVLIISHITFRDCRMHFFSDNLSRNSCIQDLRTIDPPTRNLRSSSSNLLVVTLCKLKTLWWPWGVLDLCSKIKNWTLCPSTELKTSHSIDIL